MHDIRYDEVHDELFVANPFAQAVLVFRGDAQGEAEPIRVIQGSRTQLANPQRLDVDPAHDEIFVPDGDSILVFPRTAHGDVVPLRVIRGPDTRLRHARSIAVDPVRNLIVAAPDRESPEGRSGAFWIFNRTDNGNVKPSRVIEGPKTGIVRINQLQVYPLRGLIIATQPGSGTDPKVAFVGIWNIEDHGDVPPRWKIGGPKSTLRKPRGVALNSRNKEVIVADMRLNAVLTYYFPEIF